MAGKEDTTSNLYELQKDLAICVQKVRIYDTYTAQTKRNIAKLRITINEIDTLNSQHKVYRLLGSAFFLEEKTNLKNDLEETIKKREVEIDEFQKYKGHYEGKTKDLEKQIKELVK